MATATMRSTGRYVLKYQGFYLNIRTQEGGVPVWGANREKAKIFASVDEANAFRGALRPEGELQQHWLDEAKVMEWGSLA